MVNRSVNEVLMIALVFNLAINKYLILKYMLPFTGAGVGGLGKGVKG